MALNTELVTELKFITLCLISLFPILITFSNEDKILMLHFQKWKFSPFYKS